MVDHPTSILEEGIAVGFSGGPVWSTSVVTSISGREQRNRMRVEPVHAYTFTGANQKREGLLALKAFHSNQRGRHLTFLLKDWSDYQVIAEPIGVGDGVQTTFPLTKTYPGANDWVRPIRHVKDDTLKVYVDGIEVEEGWAFTNGNIVFDPAPANLAAITANFEFYVPVRFQQDEFAINVNVAGGHWGSTGALDCIEVLE